MNYSEFSNLFDAIDETVSSRFFKGGKKDAAIAFSNISALIEQYSGIANTAEFIFDLYKFTVTRCEMGMSISRILLSFKLPPYCELPESFVMKLVVYVKMHLDDPIHYCSSNELSVVLNEKIKAYRAKKELLDSVTKPNESSYGLTLDNPIMLMSIPKAYSYLDRLLPHDGVVVETKRLFSTSSAIIPDILDEYEITVKRSNGVLEKINIFIDSYGEDEYEFPPADFSLKSLTREESLAISFKNIFNFNQLHPVIDFDRNEDLSQYFISNKPMAKFCRKCGFELLPDSLFCSMCGTKVE